MELEIGTSPLVAGRDDPSTSMLKGGAMRSCNVNVRGRSETSNKHVVEKDSWNDVDLVSMSPSLKPDHPVLILLDSVHANAGEVE